MKSTFVEMCSFVNERFLNNQECFSRKELIVRLTGEEPNSSKRVHKSKSSGLPLSECTIDGYRNMFTQAGYLSSDGKGNYKVLKCIEPNITLPPLS